MKKVMLIYNPKSGEEKSAENLDKIISIHQEHGLYVCPFRLQEDFNLKEALNSSEEYEYVIAMGGDGALNSVVNALKANKIDIPIAVLPAGTANDFAKFIGIPLNVEEACIQIIKSTPKLMDIGRLNNSYFTNLASTGFFANPNEPTDDSQKTKMGRVAYTLNAINQIKDIQCYDFKIEAKEYSYEGSLLGVIVLNGKTMANVEVASDASISDGALDVLVVKEQVLESKFQNVIKLITSGKFENLQGIDYFQTSKLLIQCISQPLTDLDGERGPNLPGKIHCIPKGIRILGVKENP
ncbi:YegS/Rv2252/BmrU family lipid kinase [Clostridium polynesiense]|uniref:YegS/Rv2252/BmrU family lipid kinase n=1 Tax=Clostridium polynesiense TaxID=1325933 RepID=UPI00058F29C0|nr:YegS/Rv2252/BmrU family lipid kinase [Clostridium polynesiense]